jgi:hypothetical protein
VLQILIEHYVYDEFTAGAHIITKPQIETFTPGSTKDWSHYMLWNTGVPVCLSTTVMSVYKSIIIIKTRSVYYHCVPYWLCGVIASIRVNSMILGVLSLTRALYCIVLYCIVLYCIVLYCISLSEWLIGQCEDWQSDIRWRDQDRNAWRDNAVRQ